MSRLQRSSVSFRRQGSSGRIWDDPLRSLDLKGLSMSTAVVAPLQAGASILAVDPSPRAAPSSDQASLRHGCGGASSTGIIAESPDVVASDRSPASVVVHRVHGARHERPARRRRRLSSAFCACMGHPPASHAQQ
ncbi:uncharacterized protein LOC133890049 [Phragmites australis]|uniref:uncharacterized protein LOC133890049 n=1 Tax=Phragmites australis TaxID=29695 RepID=UPI002D79E95D|nr:uncharacterized protein LOC133890049 [Phragmites australis]